MTETARALNAGEVTELIGDHIATFLDGGPNRKAEDIELGRKAGLDFENLSPLGRSRKTSARTYLKIADCCRSDNNVE